MKCKQCEKILLATDGSDSARNAVSYALGLAKSSEAQLFTLYVIPGVDMYAGIRDISWAESMNKHFIKEGEEANREVIDAGKDAGIEVSAFLLEGNPGELIVDFAESNDVDMIVMGTRGRTGVSRFLLGSVAEKVVRHSKKPVLVVP